MAIIQYAPRQGSLHHLSCWHAGEDPAVCPVGNGCRARWPRFITEEGGLAPVSVYGAEQEDCRKTHTSRTVRLCHILAPGVRSDVGTRVGSIYCKGWKRNCNVAVREVDRRSLWNYADVHSRGELRWREGSHPRRRGSADGSYSLTELRA